MNKQPLNRGEEPSTIRLLDFMKYALSEGESSVIINLRFVRVKTGCRVLLNRGYCHALCAKYYQICGE